MKKPNFFIIGAPKCGTTAMSEYLSSHPSVFMSTPKEPNYFSRAYVTTRFSSETPYLRLFEGAGPEHHVIGEASIRYIHSERALQALHSFQPGAKLLVMLRRPAELIQSYHRQMVKHGYEVETNLEKAWHLQETRCHDKKATSTSGSAYLLNYRWIGSLGTQVEQVFKHFNSTRVHIIFYDDFATAPHREYNRLLSFLGLAEDGRMNFAPVNEATQYRWTWLGQFPRQLRRQLAGPLSTFRASTGLQGTGILKLLDRFNTQALKGNTADPAFLRFLDQEFSREVGKLEQLLDRNLSEWRSSPTAGTNE